MNSTETQSVFEVVPFFDQDVCSLNGFYWTINGIRAPCNPICIFCRNTNYSYWPYRFSLYKLMATTTGLTEVQFCLPSASMRMAFSRPITVMLIHPPNPSVFFRPPADANLWDSYVTYFQPADFANYTLVTPVIKLSLTLVSVYSRTLFHYLGPMMHKVRLDSFSFQTRPLDEFKNSSCFPLVIFQILPTSSWVIAAINSRGPLTVLIAVILSIVSAVSFRPILRVAFEWIQRGWFLHKATRYCLYSFFALIVLALVVFLIILIVVIRPEFIWLPLPLLVLVCLLFVVVTLRLGKDQAFWDYVRRQEQLSYSLLQDITA
jgi:hypothetical protein